MLIEGPVKRITFIRDMMKTIWLFSITRLQTDQLTTIQSLPQCSSDSFVYCIGIWQSNWYAKTLDCPVMCDVDFAHSYCFNVFIILVQITITIILMVLFFIQGHEWIYEFVYFDWMKSLSDCTLVILLTFSFFLLGSNVMCRCQALRGSRHLLVVWRV